MTMPDQRRPGRSRREIQRARRDLMLNGSARPSDPLAFGAVDSGGLGAAVRQPGRMSCIGRAAKQLAGR